MSSTQYGDETESDMEWLKKVKARLEAKKRHPSPPEENEKLVPPKPPEEPESGESNREP